VRRRFSDGFLVLIVFACMAATIASGLFRTGSAQPCGPCPLGASCCAGCGDRTSFESVGNQDFQQPGDRVGDDNCSESRDASGPGTCCCKISQSPPFLTCSFSLSFLPLHAAATGQPGERLLPCDFADSLYRPPRS
jgi:hypothetical protein